MVDRGPFVFRCPTKVVPDCARRKFVTGGKTVQDQKHTARGNYCVVFGLSRSENFQDWLMLRTPGRLCADS